MISGTEHQDEPIKPSSSRFYRYGWGIAALLSLLCIAVGFSQYFTAWYTGLPSISGKTLSIASVVRGDLVRELFVSGHLVAARAPQLYSSSAGTIRLLKNPGELVKKGDIIAEVKSPELEALLEKSVAQLNTLAAALNRGDLLDKELLLDLQREMTEKRMLHKAVNREKQRVESLYVQKAVSLVEKERVADQWQASKLAYQFMQKKVKLAKERVIFDKQSRLELLKQQEITVTELERQHAELSIAAPVSGRVGNWLVGQGEQVPNPQAVMTIVDLSHYEVELLVPELYASDLREGLQIKFKVSEQSKQGEIVNISPEVDDGQIKVRAKLLGVNTEVLRQNQRINVRLEFERKSRVLQVRKYPYFSENTLQKVFLVGMDNTVREEFVRFGSASVDAIEVVQGLNEGDRVVISDSRRLKGLEAFKLVE